MINLLPTIQKEELLEEEFFKLILIFGIIFVAFLVTFALILFSIQSILTGRLESQKIFFTQREKELNISQIENLEKEIRDYNLIFSGFNSFYKNQIDLTEPIEKIARLLPKTVYLTNFSFTPEEKYLGKISISGFSPDRDTLIEFKNSLETEKNFANIDFPPVDWVSPININFTVNFNIKK